MKKLKITVVSEKTVAVGKAGCGRNWGNLCGTRDCTGGRRAG